MSPSSHYWDDYPGTMSCSVQLVWWVDIRRLNLRSSNEFQWLEFKERSRCITVIPVMTITVMCHINFFIHHTFKMTAFSDFLWLFGHHHNVATSFFCSSGQMPQYVDCCQHAATSWGLLYAGDFGRGGRIDRPVGYISTFDQCEYIR